LVVDQRDDHMAGGGEVLTEVARQARRVEDAVSEACAQVDSSTDEQRARLAETFARQQAQADTGLLGLIGRVRHDTGAQSNAVVAAAGGSRRQIQEQAGSRRRRPGSASTTWPVRPGNTRTRKQPGR
jgi:hypothetical protein